MRVVLYDALDEWVDPPGCEIQRNLQPEKGGLGALWNKRCVQHPIERSQGAARAHEQTVCYPELGLVFVPNGQAVRDAEAPPEDAQDVDAQEYVRPLFDVQLGVVEAEEPRERPDAREDDHHEAVDGVYAAASLDARRLEKESTEKLDEVAVSGVPHHPAYAQLECIGISTNGAYQLEP